MKQKKKGFTIVELVIVIVVIAILAAVLIPTFTGLLQKAKLSADERCGEIAAIGGTVQQRTYTVIERRIFHIFRNTPV